MSRHGGPVLLDNNAIGAAVDAGCFAALAGAYQLETVTEVAAEAGSYFRKLSGHNAVQSAFNANVKVNAVSDVEVAEVLVRLIGISLDDGERDLWAHAFARQGNWILCGPDRASMRAAYRLGLRGQVVSLEKLLRDAGIKKPNLPHHYTDKWLDQAFVEISFEEARR